VIGEGAQEKISYVVLKINNLGDFWAALTIQDDN